MSTNSNQAEAANDQSKAQLKTGLIVAAVVVALGLAIYSGVHNMQQPLHVVGTLGADGKVHYNSEADAKAAGAPAGAATDGATANSAGGGQDANSNLPPSKQ